MNSGVTYASRFVVLSSFLLLRSASVAATYLAGTICFTWLSSQPGSPILVTKGERGNSLNGMTRSADDYERGHVFMRTTRPSKSTTCIESFSEFVGITLMRRSPAPIMSTCGAEAGIRFGNDGEADATFVRNRQILCVGSQYMEPEYHPARRYVL